MAYHSGKVRLVVPTGGGNIYRVVQKRGAQYQIRLFWNMPIMKKQEAKKRGPFN